LCEPGYNNAAITQQKKKIVIDIMGSITK